MRGNQNDVSRLSDNLDRYDRENEDKLARQSRQEWEEQHPDLAPIKPGKA